MTQNMSAEPKSNRTTHTPGPWRVERERNDFSVIDSQGLTMCLMTGGLDPIYEPKDFIGPTTEANAEFIVRACNVHDDLLEALKEALRYLDDGDPETEFVKSFETGRSVSITRLRAAIAKAEGK